MSATTNLGVYLVSHYDVAWVVVAYSREDAKAVVIREYFDDESLREELTVSRGRELVRGVVADFNGESLDWK